MGHNHSNRLSGHLTPDEHARLMASPPRFVEPRLPGLGDVVEAATSALGIPPCPPCLARREALNKRTPRGVKYVLHLLGFR